MYSDGERERYVDKSDKNIDIDMKNRELRQENKKLRDILKDIKYELESAEDPDVITHLIGMLKGFDIGDKDGEKS